MINLDTNGQVIDQAINFARTAKETIVIVEHKLGIDWHSQTAWLTQSSLKPSKLKVIATYNPMTDRIVDFVMKVFSLKQ